MPFAKLQASCHEPFTEEWCPSGQSTIKTWLVGCCRDGCPSGRFSHLHRGTLEDCQWPSVTSAIPQFGRAASSRVSVVPNFFHLRMMEATVLFDDLQCCRNFLVPFPRSVPRHNPDLMACFLLWHALYTGVFSFSIEFTTGGLQSSCRNISMKTGCTWAQFWVS